MLEWAVTSSVLILAVLLLRQCLKGKVSPRLQYGLWALVLLRLLIPVSFGSTAVSVLNAVERVEDRVPAPAVSYIGGETPDLAPAEPDPSLPPAKQQTQYEQHLAQWQAELDAAQAETGTPVTVGMVLMLLWAAGAALLGLWLAGVNLRFRRALVRSRKSLAVEGFPLPVYVTGAVPTPCLFGLVRPAVYVTPEAAADGTVLRHSLAHELTHFRHRDHLWAALRGLCLALHWYNPLVWLAASLSRRDGELCCDEATVKRLGEAERAAYGRTLLAVTCQGRADPLLTATSMTGGKGIQERIVLLAKRPKTAARSLALVVLVAAAAAGCTFTGAEKDGFVPDRVSMGQSLSSTMGSTITDPETVARLWDLYQGFTLGEPADPDDVWTLSVRFSAEDTEEMAGFDLTRDGLYSTDRETYYVLEDGAELYQEFHAAFVEQQARDRAAEDDFVPDRVTMGQALSSTLGSTITDPETVARLWDLCQGFTLGGPADPDGVWTLSVCFATEDTAKMEWFILTPDGLYSADWETYYVLEDGVELYQEFYGVYEEQQTRDRWRRA